MNWKWLLMASLLLLACCMVIKRPTKETGLSERVKNGAILLDVRTASEFSGGHLAGARNMSLGRLRKECDKLEPGATYVTYCTLGLRSKKAVQILKERGFANVYDGGPMDQLERSLKKDGVLK